MMGCSGQCLALSDDRIEKYQSIRGDFSNNYLADI